MYYLGKTYNKTTVHPHVRGEHAGDQRRVADPRGSSPRTWGTCSGFDLRKLTRRFIPTYVGNILPVALEAAAFTVHPHVRGEHLPCV